MPIYEYRCDACGHEHEAIRKFSDAPLTTCPACGKDTLVKKVSAAGFQLKGSGWYQTDFRGGAKPAAAPAVKSDAATAEAKSGGDDKGATSAPVTAADTSAPKAETKPTPTGGSSAPA